MSEEHPDPKQRWGVMRRFAALALLHAFSIPLWVEYVPVEIVPPMLLFDAAIVGGYMGFSTARDGWGNK